MANYGETNCIGHILSLDVENTFQSGFPAYVHEFFFTKKYVSLAFVFFNGNSLKGSYHSLSMSPPQPYALFAFPANSLQLSSGNRSSGIWIQPINN